MKDEITKKTVVDREDIPGDETNCTRLNAMTDEEALANALSDPDCPPREIYPKGALKRVVRPQWTRRRLGMSQREFAEAFGFSLRSLQAWEKGRSQPSRAIRFYLRVISVDPDAVLKALKGPRLEQP